MKITVHAAPLVESLYIFKDTCTYDSRDEPECIVDAIYTHEGERAYLSGLRGRFSREVARAIAKHIAARGAVQLEYERHGRQKIIELV